MKSPWMTTAEAAEYLRFIGRDGQPDQERVREFLRDERVQPFKRGRMNLYRREDVENTLRVTRVVKAAR